MDDIFEIIKNLSSTIILGFIIWFVFLILKMGMGFENGLLMIIALIVADRIITSKK